MNKSISTYSQFGSYITSITPGKFSAKLNIMCYQDYWDYRDKATHMISYIDGHDNDPNYEIALFADFSNNQEVSVTPILYSTDLIDGIFKQKEVTFNYFNFVPYYLFQEVDLPVQYNNISLTQFNGGVNVEYSYDSGRGNILLKAQDPSFLNPLFGQKSNNPCGWVFGSTDSTFLFNQEGAEISPSADYPFGNNTRAPVIRSNKYDPVTVTMPPEGETIEMYSTISFDTQNLIQIYAGNDNIPYSSDDIFVYAPNYWERVNVKLEIK